MDDRFNCSNGNTARYLARPPERLVLEGYRHWTLGYATGSPSPWQGARTLYRELLSEDDVQPAIAALSDFVGTLGLCASCPLKMFACGSRHICRDESLVMGLIAGIQNRDDEATELCLTGLSCRSRCEDVALAAGTFAFVLTALSKVLMPIPASVVRDILARSEAAERRHTGATLH